MTHLGDASLFADGPPHELFAQMRDAATLHFTPPVDDLPGYYSLTRYADVVRANKDWRTFSSAGDGISIRPSAIVPAEFAPLAFIFMDPPAHNRHRAIIQTVFTASSVNARADDIRRITNNLIDAVIEQGSCDLVADIGALFPLTVTSNLLGVPESDHARLFAWTNAIADTELPPEPKLALMGELFEFIMSLIQARRTEPRDDLLSRLIAAEVDSESLSDMDIALHFVQITAGGNETTRDAFAGGMEALMAQPDQRQLLIDDPTRIPNAVEEILRWHTPIHAMARTATTDIQISGTTIETGQRVALWYCSANRDPQANAEPNRFDITRTKVNHVAFGGGGVHYCIGNQLSRLELAIALEEVLRRLPDTQPSGPVIRKPSTVFHSITSLPVTFIPRERTPR